MRWWLRFSKKKRVSRSLSGSALAALVFACGLLFPQLSFCDQLQVKAALDRPEVALGEPFNFQVVISGVLKESPQVDVSSLQGFGVLATRQSRQIRVQGGQTVQSVALIYTLVGEKTGTYALGPVKVTHEGKTYETEPVKVKVVRGRAGEKLRKKEPEPSERPRLQGGVIL